MKTLLYIIIAFLSIQIKAQTNLGINTDAPTTTVDVNGTMRVRNIATPQPYNSSDLLVWADGGILKTTDKNKVFPTVPVQTGTLMSDGTNVIVAPEFEVQMSNDQSFTSSTPSVISNLNVEILDNLEEIGLYGFQNGTFKVDNTGYYSVFFNLQVNNTANNNPVFGIWDDAAGKWITSTNDYYSAIITDPNYTAEKLQSYTIYTSVKLEANKTYSVRAKTSSGTVTIKKLSSGSTGEGPVTQIAIRRIS